MFPALNMELEIVRTVLKNPVCEIYVCTDLKRGTGVFYTLIAILDSDCRRTVAGRVGSETLFSSNSDYIGSFSYKNTFNLVFLYKRENRLSSREAIYTGSFADCRKLAVNFLIACAESEIYGDMGQLLVNSRNVNVGPDGRVYFNYFLDFADYKSTGGDSAYYKQVAEYAFDLLAYEYHLRFDRTIADYPDELQLFYRKLQAGGFTTFRQLITFIRQLPDKLTARKGFFRKLSNAVYQVRSFVTRNSMALFVAVLVAVTVVYAAYQIILRTSTARENGQNTPYVGVDRIGGVYLGDE